MDIEKIKDKKDELAFSIMDLVAEFSDETGVMVTGLSLNLMDVSAVGDKRTKLVYGGVKITVEL